MRNRFDMITCGVVLACVSATLIAASPGRLPTASGEIPVGTVIAFAGTTPPPDWMVADGRALLESDYPALWKAIGQLHGAGYNEAGIRVGEFNLPDYRGMFLRGVDLSSAALPSGNDPDAARRVAPRGGGSQGNTVGSIQLDAMQKHKHLDAGHHHSLVGWTYRQAGDRVPRRYGLLDNTPGQNVDVNDASAQLGDPVDAGTGGGAPRLSVETRPRNAAVLYIIRVR